MQTKKQSHRPFAANLFSAIMAGIALLVLTVGCVQNQPQENSANGDEYSGRVALSADLNRIVTETLVSNYGPEYVAQYIKIEDTAQYQKRGNADTEYSVSYQLDYPGFESVTTRNQSAPFLIGFIRIQNGKAFMSNPPEKNCVQDPKQCPPFPITKSDALQRLTGKTSIAETDYDSLNLVFEHQTPAGRIVDEFTWAVSRCPPSPYSEVPGPVPLGHPPCQTKQISAQTGEMLYEGLTQ